MAAQIGSIYIGLEVDVGRISRFRDAANAVDRDSRRIRNALGGTSKSVQSLRGAMSQEFRTRMFGDAIRTISRTNDEVSRLRASFMALSAITGTGLTSTLAATFLLQTADRARLLSNQLRTVTSDEENLIAVQEKLYQVSQRTRSSFQASTTIFARTARAVDGLGFSQQNLLRITETIQKAFAVGGATQAEASGAAIQLSQGIASNRFSGEEFRSVAENAPVLLSGIAKSLGVNIGKLREMAFAGELTAKVVTDAILKASADIDAAFDKTTMTVGQSLTKLDNAFLQYIGKADQSYGVTRRLSEAIAGLADNMDQIAGVAGLALAGGAALLGGRAASGLVGKGVNNWSQQRKDARDALDAMRQQQQSMAAQQVELRKSIALRQAEHVQIVAAGHAVGISAKEQYAAQVATQKSLATINGLRVEGIALSKQQVVLSESIAVAQRKATAAGVAMTMAQRGAVGVLNFLGGWTGIAFTAALAGVFAYTDAVTKSAERTDRMKQELRALGLLADDAAESLDGTAKSLDDLARDEIRTKLRNINAELEKARNPQNPLDQMFAYDKENLANILNQLAQMQRIARGSNSSKGTDRAAAREVEAMLRDFMAGNLEAEELQRRLDEIAQTDLSKGMDELISSTRAAVAYVAGLLALQGQVASKLNQQDHGWIDQIIADEKAQKEQQQAQKLRGDYIDELKRQGNLSEADRAIEDRMAKIKKDLPDGAAGMDDASVRALAIDLIALDKAAKDAADSSEDGAKASKRYAEGLAELQLQAKAAPLSSFYQDVLKTADSLGIGTAELEKFIEAVSSGNLDAAPARIREIADSMREVNAARLERQVLDQRATMFMSDTDKLIYESLRDAGIDINSAQGQMISNQMKLNAELSYGRDLLVSFFGDMRQSLAQGMNWWDALRDAAANALDSIADRALNMAANGIFDLIAGAIGGAIGGGFGGFKLPNLLNGGTGGLTGSVRVLHGGTARVGNSAGLGHGRSFPMSAWAGAPRFHEGTMAAGFKANELPAVLRKGEVVDPGDGSVFMQRFGGIVYAPVINGGGSMTRAQLRAELAASKQQFENDLPRMLREAYRRGGM